jgi:hypothetical protein
VKGTRAVGAGAGRLLAVRLVRCAPVEAGGCGKLDRQEIRSTGPATKGYVQERARPEPCERTRSAIREHIAGKGTA